MGCIMPKIKTAPTASASPAPAPKVTEAAGTEAPAIVQEKVAIVDFVRHGQPEDEEVTGKRSPVPEPRKRRESLQSAASEAAATTACAAAAETAQAPYMTNAQPATRKAENRRRTGLSNVAKLSSAQTQIGLASGMDFSLQCDFPALPGQVSPRFSRPVLPGEDAAATSRPGGLLHPAAKSSLSSRPAGNDYPDESCDDLPPIMQAEPQASPTEESRQQQHKLMVLASLTMSPGDREEETESSSRLEIPKLVANADAGGGDHFVGGGEQAAWETDERKLTKKQSQGDLLLQPSGGGGTKEDAVFQLLSSSAKCPGLFSGDHYICHPPTKPVTYSGICKSTIAQEFYFSVEDILQQQLPCNVPDVIELAAATGTAGVEGLTASPNAGSFSSQNPDAPSNEDAGTRLPPIHTHYE